MGNADSVAGVDSPLVAFVYVLSLSNGRYYVGKVTNRVKKISDHDWGLSTSKWVSGNSPFCILEVHPYNAPDDEDVQVKRLMLLHGIENVRGGPYSSVDLSDSTVVFLRKELYGPKHPIYVALEEVVSCTRCGRKHHDSSRCYAKRHFDGHTLDV